MSLLQNGSLLRFVSDKVKGFEIKRITSVSGIYVVDTKGYIGIKINDYFSQNGSPYPGNYALVAKGPSYQSLGLGQVTFLEETIGSVTIGDKTYRTVVMPDGKEWMAENLDFLPSDGSIAKNPSGSPSTAAAWYYIRDEATYGWEGKRYGLLYNWYAAKALTIAGWHLPSTTEWDALATACGGASSCGTKLKSTTEWSSGNGTDNWGFTAFPSGYYNGSFNNVGSQSYFWTSVENSSNGAYYRCLDTGTSLNSTDYRKTSGYSIRLVKDS